MRIQHNIPAMNAYRNYNNNTSALSKNLEKLSSGYKINRAGDDAAGLAISEKMRAQITGLNAAQKNVKDGVSLVKTAEGAMQEIQDMLNRMDYLATQSANGTYDNEVDRANLQKEVDALKTEINRIADSANFNGIKLLDGSLVSKSTSALGAANAQVLDMINGTSPTKAGAAEVTLKLANSAAAAAAALDPKTAVDGKIPTAATREEIKLTMGQDKTMTFSGTVNGADIGDVTTLDLTGWKTGDVIKTTLADGTVNTYDFGTYNTAAAVKAQLATDGLTVGGSGTNDITAKQTATIGDGNTISLVAGTATVQDLKDVVVTAGGTPVKVGALYDITIEGKTNLADTDKLDAGAKITLTAKNPGAQTADAGTLFNSLVGNDGKAAATYVTKGEDERYPSDPTSVTEYNLEIDLDKLKGGQYIEVGGKGITFKTDGTATNVGSAGTATDPYIVDLNGGQVDDDLESALNKIFTTTNFKAADVDKGTTFKYSVEGKNNSVIADSNMGQVRVFDGNGKETTGNDPAVTKAEYKAATKDGTPPPSQPFATLEYEIAKADLQTVGSKLTIGGKTLEIAAASDLANGKVSKDALDTDIAAALEQMGYKSGKVTVDVSGTNAKITIQGVTQGEKASDLQKGAGSVAFVKAGSVPASTATVKGGMTIEARKTTITQIKGADMPEGKKLSDLFDITVNGSTQADGYIIKEGDEIKFTAKNNGKLVDGVMDKFAFTGNVDSLTKQNGWDEGAGATGDKTHYELAIDLSKVVGGNSFTFGNVNGKSITFDLSYDTEGTKNDTVGDKDNTDLSNNAKRVTINLYGKTTAEAQEEIFNQVKTEMGKAGFDVTRAVNGSTVTLKLDAQKEGNEYNLGNIRTSAASGALTNAVYIPAGGAAGGTPGTMAQVTYNFDVSQLQAGDQLTIGGTTISIGEESKKEVVDGEVKLTVSASEAKANPNKAIVEALEAAGYRSGQVRFDTANKKVTITGITTGETAEQLKTGGASMASVTSGNRSMTAGGLTLQIGDTSESFNQMTVSIGDMHTKAMGTTGGKSIADVDISNQAGASEAVQVIKDAINYVSSIRGDLGATQNRLDHTASNLSVMAENIQDAESTIRDTDVAEEMMSYVKNNILVQSAQAMLAQANQLPQGVLQLLG